MDEGGKMKNNMIIITALWLLSFTNILLADTDYPNGTIEAKVTYDFLRPESVYDSWKSAEVRFNHMFNPENTLILAAGGSIRDETFGWFQTALYKDWHPRFYTYTSATLASNTKWMGWMRLDNDFNLKFGNDAQYVAVFGQTAILYPDDKADYILSVGGIWYLPGFMIDGRYFFNRSDPGKVWSNSAKLGIGFGIIEDHWTTITATAGKQSYLGLDGLGQVNQNVTSIDFMQQLWFNQGSGIKFGVGYSYVENGYEKYNASIGYFYKLY